MFKILILFFLSFSIAYAENNTTAGVDQNLTVDILEAQKLEFQRLELERIEAQKLEAQRQKKLLEEKRKNDIQLLVAKLDAIEAEISKEKVWMKSYASYMTSLDIRAKLDSIRKRINFLQRNGKSINDLDELNALTSKEKILASQIDKLKEGGSAPFSRLLTPPEIEEMPDISNPLEIFSGLSLIKTQNAFFTDYIAKKDKLSELIRLLREEKVIYEEIKQLDVEKKYEKKSELKQKQLRRFETAYETMNVAAEVYQKRLEIVEVNINKNIEKQVLRLANIGMIILVLFVIFFLLKQVVKRYITDNERFYMANKIITFTNVILIIIIIFFNYIENVSYFVTILGFASAGIAIAMKDWFMSILGWLVIVLGGSIHVGDRIRVIMDGHEYVGDVMDISLLRMTVYEDITLSTVEVNRRAGRIVFIPNNYIFTKMIANYAHHSLKTVWDGVHITVTFDSNHKKAMHIAKEVSRKYSKGYTDITRKQLNKLRSHYSLKNTNVEPRIFSFIEPNGVVIDAWYLTNAYATLTLRSIISTEIVEEFNKADDITISYPTQKLHIAREEKREAPFDTKEGTV